MVALASIRHPPPEDARCTWLYHRRSLFLLDNLGHRLEVAPPPSRLLGAGADLIVLAASGVRRRRSEEQVVSTTRLALPGDANPDDFLVPVQNAG
ncbi:MAG: hypothetical protein U0031_00740 [Thermomicrobiales bacterium]